MNLADVRAAVISRWESATDLGSVVANWKRHSLAALKGLPRHQGVISDASIPLSCWWLHMGASEKQLINVATGVDVTHRLPRRVLPFKPEVLGPSAAAARRADQLAERIENWRAWLVSIGELGSGLIHRFARNATVPALYSSLADSWSPAAFVDFLGGRVTLSPFRVRV